MEELRSEMLEMRDMYMEDDVYQLQELRQQLEQVGVQADVVPGRQHRESVPCISQEIKKSFATKHWAINHMSVMFEHVVQCEVRSIVDFECDPSNKQHSNSIFQ